MYVQYVCYPQDTAESMVEDVQLCFKKLIDTINQAQNRAISFIEAQKVGALQKIEKQKERLDNHMVSISLIKDKIDECINNDSYFNFLLVSVWLFFLLKISSKYYFSLSKKWLCQIIYVVSFF